MENINVNPEFSPKSPDVERQLAELRLEERERFLRTLISNLPGIVYRCRTDEEWTSEFMSDGVEIVGYSAADFVEKRSISWDDVLHPEDRERVRAAVRDLMSESVPFSTVSHLFSYRLTSKSGDIKHVRDRFRFVFDRAGVIVALEGVITDVTELTLADERVGESENRYRRANSRRAAPQRLTDFYCRRKKRGVLKKADFIIYRAGEGQWEPQIKVSRN